MLPPVAIQPSVIRRWLQAEGLFSTETTRQDTLAQWDIRVPINPQQSINMGVAIPKDKNDQVHVNMTIIPGPQQQQIVTAATDDQKQQLIKRIGQEFLRQRDLFPLFGLQADGKLGIIVTQVIYQDAPMTKERLMSAIRSLRNAFLWYDFSSPDIFRQFSPEGELLSP